MFLARYAAGEVPGLGEEVLMNINVTSWTCSSRHLFQIVFRAPLTPQQLMVEASSWTRLAVWKMERNSKHIKLL